MPRDITDSEFCEKCREKRNRKRAAVTTAAVFSSPLALALAAGPAWDEDEDCAECF